MMKRPRVEAETADDYEVPPQQQTSASNSDDHVSYTPRQLFESRNDDCRKNSFTVYNHV